MATKKKPVDEVPEGKVRVTIPRARAHEDPNFFVAINGKNYLIPKGTTVDVPEAVAEEIWRAEAAEARFYDKADELKVKQ